MQNLIQEHQTNKQPKYSSPLRQQQTTLPSQLNLHMFWPLSKRLFVLPPQQGFRRIINNSYNSQLKSFEDEHRETKQTVNVKENGTYVPPLSSFSQNIEPQNHTTNLMWSSRIYKIYKEKRGNHSKSSIYPQATNA